MSQNQLQKVSDTEKTQQQSNVDHEQAGRIGQELSAGYNAKSLGMIDAQHDAKVISLKYLEDGYKQGKLKVPEKADLNIQQFVDVRNELGKDFFDNMLYKYDVPYNEISLLADALKTNEKYCEHDIQEYKNNVQEDASGLVTLLEDMHEPDKKTQSPNEQIVEKAPVLDPSVEKRIIGTGFTKDQAALLNQKYLTNAAAISGFDLKEETNVVTGKGKEVKNKNGITKVEGTPGMKEFLKPFTDIKHAFGEGFLTMILENDAIAYDKLTGFSASLQGIAVAVNKGEIRITQAEQKAVLTELQEGTFDAATFLETQKGETLIATDILTIPKNESTNHKVVREWQTKLFDGFSLSVQKEGKQILGNKLDADSANNLAWGLTGRFHDLLQTRVNTYLLSSKDKQISTLELGSIGQKVKNELAPEITRFLKDLNTMKIKDGENTNDYTTLAQTKEFSSPDGAYTFLKDYFAKLPTDAKQLVLTSQGTAEKGVVKGVVKADYVALKKTLDGLTTQLETALRSPTEGEQYAKQAESFFGQLGEMGKGAVEWLKSPAIQEVMNVFKQLFGLMGFGTEFFDNILKLNDMKEANLSPVAIKALDAGQKLAVTSSIKNIPLTTDNKPDILKIGNQIKEDKALFNDASFGKERAPDKSWSSAFKKEAGTHYATLFVSFNKKNPGVTDPDLMDLAMWNMATPDDFIKFTTARNEGKASDASTLFAAAFDAGVSDVAETATKDNRKWGEKLPNETAVRSILARMIDSKKAAEGIATASSNEVAKSAEAGKLEIAALTDKVKMHVGLDKKLKLEGIPQGTVLGIKVGDKDPVEYKDGGIPIADLGPVPKFSLVKLEKDKTRSSGVRVDDITVFNYEKVNVADDKTNVTMTGLDAGDYVTKTNYMHASTPTFENKEYTLPTNDSTLTHTFATDKGTPTTLEVKPKTGGLRQTVWKS